jgi:hypothetical protein
VSNYQDFWADKDMLSVRPPQVKMHQWDMYQHALAGATIREIATEFGVSRGVAYYNVSWAAACAEALWYKTVACPHCDGTGRMPQAERA